MIETIGNAATDYFWVKFFDLNPNAIVSDENYIGMYEANYEIFLWYSICFWNGKHTYVPRLEITSAGDDAMKDYLSDDRKNCKRNNRHQKVTFVRSSSK